MAGFSREVAHRVFARELHDTTLSLEKDSEDMYAPQYVLTPTGARVNRMFVVGTLTEVDNIGNDVDYWRGRIVDPTGTFFVYAGQYQPEAAAAISEMELPSFVAVVGKAHIYEAEDGKITTSVRPESIMVVDKDVRDRWVLDTAKRTLERLGSMDRDDWSKKALEHYSVDLTEYVQLATEALSTLKDK